MSERYLRGLIALVKAGKMSRRGFVQKMIQLGLTVPLANAMLAHAGVALAQTKFEYKPTKRGGGGALKVLWWQGPTLLNPHFAVGTKDQDGSRVFYEPLAAWDIEGNLVPVLAAEIPDIENGGLSRDGKTATWKLKPNVQWHDGQPFTAEDVVFNWEYASDPATAAVSIGSYKDMTVEKVDPLTVRIHFAKPTPFWANAFVGLRGMLIPKHLFEAYKGDKSRDAPANLKPVGTGPYRFVSFTPGDLVRGELNPNYHLPKRPYFDTIEMKGGGDAVSAARAVLQTGEYDYASEVGGVEDDVLQRLEQGGKGRVAIGFGGRITHVQLNQTDPWTEVDGERSSVKTVHPFLTDPAVKGALALLVDRMAIQEQILGRLGQATGNWLNNPERFRSKNIHWEFNIDKANQLLDNGGWKRGPDGVRARDGKRLKMLFATAINAPAQKMQAVIKQAAGKAGIEIEIKAVPATSFFSSDPGNPDTYTHFYSDLQLVTYVMGPPDPALLMRVFTSADVATKENKWQRFNVWRWRNEEYDRLYKQAETEMDPVKRAALYIRMNDLVVHSGIVVPIVLRAKAAAMSTRMRGMEHNVYEVDFWNLAMWSKEA